MQCLSVSCFARMCPVENRRDVCTAPLGLAETSSQTGDYDIGEKKGGEPQGMPQMNDMEEKKVIEHAGRAQTGVMMYTANVAQHTYMDEIAPLRIDPAEVADQSHPPDHQVDFRSDTI
ncbi:MAG: hypothetical protein M1816_007517 [Peltula sp. TS41687]|nr:MAG: hypothetical protein M1816_007517 [Peltula sp. TS41687]